MLVGSCQLRLFQTMRSLPPLTSVAEPASISAIFTPCNDLIIVREFDLNIEKALYAINLGILVDSYTRRSDRW